MDLRLLDEELGQAEGLAAVPPHPREPLVDQRQAAVPALAQRSDLDRLALEQLLAAQLVAHERPEAALAAQLRIQLESVVNVRNSSQLPRLHHPTSRGGPVVCADFVGEDERVRID